MILMYNETSVFIPTNTTSVLQFSRPWMSNLYFSVLSFKNKFCKAVAAMHNDFSHGSRQNLLDNILDAIINLHDSWKEVKISTLTRVWKSISPYMYDFEGFKTPEK